MDNSFFIFSDNVSNLNIERFHICTWEFSDNSSLVEFGGELDYDSINGNDKIILNLYVPWVTAECELIDLYPKLRVASNSRFIFNDSVNITSNFDGGNVNNGVVHEFTNRNSLCILPVDLTSSNNSRIITIELDLANYLNHCVEKDESNLYFRFSVQPKERSISQKKSGISMSTIIYDIKLNEKRNLPETIDAIYPCVVKQCFCFNIIPTSYNPVFFDSSYLKSIRTLERDKFNQYLGDSRVGREDLVVVFNKKKAEESYSFFSIYSNEKIGTSQIAIALLLNLLSGILLFFPSLRGDAIDHKWNNLPIEVYFALALWGLAVTYVIFPSLYKRILPHDR